MWFFKLIFFQPVPAEPEKVEEKVEEKKKEEKSSEKEEKKEDEKEKADEKKEEKDKEEKVKILFSFQIIPEDFFVKKIFSPSWKIILKWGLGDWKSY